MLSNRYAAELPLDKQPPQCNPPISHFIAGEPEFNYLEL